MVDVLCVCSQFLFINYCVSFFFSFSRHNRFLPSNQALVGNLPYRIRDQDIMEFFHECGVTDIYLVKDRETGDMKVKGLPTNLTAFSSVKRFTDNLTVSPSVDRCTDDNITAFPSVNVFTDDNLTAFPSFNGFTDDNLTIFSSPIRLLIGMVVTFKG